MPTYVKWASRAIIVRDISGNRSSKLIGFNVTRQYFGGFLGFNDVGVQGGDAVGVGR